MKKVIQKKGNKWKAKNKMEAEDMLAWLITLLIVVFCIIQHLR